MSRFKKCFKCYAIKPIDEFYKHHQMADGHLNKCKECTRMEARAHRNENIDRIRAYDRERSKTEARIKLRTEITREWRKQDKRRTAAHNAVARAIVSGNLTRQPCERCGGGKSVAHHDDYDKPLDIRWLCYACHAQHHSGYSDKTPHPS